MKFFLVGLLSFGLLTMPALAEPTATPIPVPKWNPALPVLMQKMRPKQAKTRFFGEVKFPTPVHNRYFLHFYEFPQTPPLIYAAGVRHSNSDKDYRVDLFVRYFRKGKIAYRLIRRLNIDSSYFDDDVYHFNSVSPQFIWLVPDKRQIPILQINCTDYNAFYFPFGVDILFIFNKGFGIEPIMQGFPNYNNHSDCQGYYFDKIDERGYRKVVSTYQTSFGEDPTLNDMLWNGKGFYAVPTPTPTPFPPQ